MSIGELLALSRENDRLAEKLAAAEAENAELKGALDVLREALHNCADCCCIKNIHECWRCQALKRSRALLEGGSE